MMMMHCQLNMPQKQFQRSIDSSSVLKLQAQMRDEPSCIMGLPTRVPSNTYTHVTIQRHDTRIRNKIIAEF